MSITALNSPAEKESEEEAMVVAGRRELASLFWWALGAATVSQLNNTT